MQFRGSSFRISDGSLIGAEIASNLSGIMTGVMKIKRSTGYFTLVDGSTWELRAATYFSYEVYVYLAIIQPLTHKSKTFYMQSSDLE